MGNAAIGPGRGGASPAEEEAEALLESANDAARQARAFFITFLALSFYIGIIVWSTTDEMLLRVAPVRLPLLNVELPIRGFYAFTPWVYLLFHFNLLIQLYLLADKLHRFSDAATGLPERRACLTARLFSFAFSHHLAGTHHRRLPRFILSSMVWITMVWLPLAVLLGLQIGFLPFHDAEVLPWQRAAVTVDVLLLLVFWPLVHDEQGSPRSWYRKGWRWACDLAGRALRRLKAWAQRERNLAPIEFVRLLPAGLLQTLRRWSAEPDGGRTACLSASLLFLTALLSTGFSWFVAVLPGSSIEHRVAAMVPEAWLAEGERKETWSFAPRERKQSRRFALTAYLFDGPDAWFHRNLVLRERVLVQGQIDPELEAQLASDDEKVWKAAHKKVRGLNLRGRDLRYADFTGST
ncbi:MAG TPA: hypothetical protein ENJ98_04155, partial [Thiolapillus brandeum]|nr:hypothetical protein [Thiolapillus brandeum]